MCKEVNVQSAWMIDANTCLYDILNSPKRLCDMMCATPGMPNSPYPPAPVVYTCYAESAFLAIWPRTRIQMNGTQGRFEAMSRDSLQ